MLRGIVHLLAWIFFFILTESVIESRWACITIFYNLYCHLMRNLFLNTSLLHQQEPFLFSPGRFTATTFPFGKVSKNYRISKNFNFSIIANGTFHINISSVVVEITYFIINYRAINISCPFCNVTSHVYRPRSFGLYDITSAVISAPSSDQPWQIPP